MELRSIALVALQTEAAPPPASGALEDVVASLVVHQVTFLLSTGWSSECLLEWDSFTSLAVPSMLMICIEWWTYEIGSFLIGLLSVIELSAQSIIYEVSVVIPLGLGTAASVQVGNALGARDIETAKRSSSTSLLCTGAFSIAMGAILMATKNMLGYIFTPEKEIVDLVAWVMPVYVVFHLFEGACSGVLRGIGKQKFGAILNAISYYGVGLPLGAVLLFVARIGVIGTDPRAHNSACPQIPCGGIPPAPPMLQEATPVTSPPPTAVVTKELIIRRGLAAAAAVAVLALGIVIKLVTSKH
uniref:Solute carrier family 47 member 2 n=1 Tax=Calidris pygmaea TaxID=425635 RepID=A0A8C3JQH9_9CHAR